MADQDSIISSAQLLVEFSEPINGANAIFISYNSLHHR